MKKKILFISVPVGSGHVRAAEALHQTAKASYPDLETKHLDMMEHVAFPLRTAFLETYDMLTKQAPGIWRYMYKKTNEEKVAERLKALSHHINLLQAPHVLEEIRAFDPDHIVATHLLPAHYVSQMKALGHIRASLSFVLTDYDCHELMHAPGIDKYFVPTEKVAWKMEQSGISTEAIVCSGIPVDPIWYSSPDMAALRKKHALDPKTPTYTLLSGGGGSVRLDMLVQALAGLRERTTLITIAGKNAALKSRIDALRLPTHITLRSLGWTDTVHEYIGASDAVVSKPGGLTSTECVVMQKPLVAVSPVPGQEEENLEYLLGEGYAVSARSNEDLRYYLSLDPKKLPRNTNTPSVSGRRAADIILQSLPLLGNIERISV